MGNWELGGCVSVLYNAVSYCCIDVRLHIASPGKARRVDASPPLAYLLAKDFVALY